jgi:hypothetical protein
MDNQLDAATGTLRVRAVMKNTDGLLSPGLFVRLRFPVGGAQKALLVQEESLGADQGERFIYVVGEDNVVKYRRVKVGVLREGKRVVRDGLAANERVIVTGLQRVKPGDKVNVRPYVAATMTSSSKSAGEAKKPAAATSPNPMTSKSETGNAEAKPGEAKAPMPPSS